MNDDAPPPDPEDELRIPDEWDRHLDGRPDGRLSLERAEGLFDDPYAGFDGSDYERLRRDVAAVPYTFVASLPPDEALERIEELAPIGGYAAADEQRGAAEAMSVLPIDAAFDALLMRSTQAVRGGAARNERYFGEALQAACARFPRRALRRLAAHVLGSSKPAERCRALLMAHVRRDPARARALAPSLPDAERAAIEALLREDDVTFAPPEAWPAVLREPPWTRPKAKAAPKPKPLALAPLPFEPTLEWRGDERARFAASAPQTPAHYRALTTDAMWIATREFAQRNFLVGTFLLAAPLPMARELASALPPAPHYARHMRALIARLGLDVLELARAEAVMRPNPGVARLLPFRDPTLAPMMASALARPTTRDAAAAWLARHPEAAAIGALPDALGADAKRRKAALAALVHLAATGHRDVILDVARRYGDAAHAALTRLLEVDPLAAFPKRLPAMPAFWDPAIHPAPVLKSGAGALPPEALEPLGVMLAFSRLGAPYAGLAEVRAACTRDSLARFGWSLFESWLAAGADAKQRWAFLALAWLGDDSTAYRLDALMKDWPRQGAARRAELGLDVLAEMDSDVALVLVNQMAERSRARSLKKNAQKKMAAIAAARQLGPDELADRLVPRFDLDDDGAMVLDYGPRRFVVGFDEELRPTVRDEGGAPRKTLPKPSKRDDPTKAPEAQQRYKALTKAVRTIAKAEVARLERALASERTWSAPDFRAYVVGHPLLVHLARRLVWARYVNDALEGTFRVAEDRTFADIDDEALALADDDRIGLAHPLTMSADQIARWRERFSDYELLQPFPQLAREVFAPPAGQRASEHARGFLGVSVAAHRLLALESRGWQRGEIQDGGAWYHVERALDPTRTALLTFSPGVFVGDIAGAEPPTLEELLLREGDSIAPLESLTPVALSELCRDLAWLNA